MITRRFGLIAAAVLCLCACESGRPGGLPLPQMTFAQIQPMPVNVRLVNASVSESDAVDDFAIDPGAAAKQYLARRFVAAGNSGALEINVEKAAVVKTHEAAGNSVAGFLNVGGADAYAVTLIVRFEHLDEGGRVLYGKVLTARRIVRISEHDSLATRERRQMEAMEALFSDLDREIRIAALEDKSLAL